LPGDAGGSAGEGWFGWETGHAAPSVPASRIARE